MQGGVVVVEHKPLVGQFVERGCQLRVDGVAGEPLDDQLDDVVPFEHAGIFIFSGGGGAAEVVGQPGNVLIGGIGGERLQVHIHYVGRGVYHGMFLHRGGVSAGAISRAVQTIQTVKIGVQPGLGREEHVLDVQAQHGHQPQLFHLVVEVCVGAVELGGSQISRPRGVDHSQTQQMKGHGSGGKDSRTPAWGLSLGQSPPKQRPQQESGQKEEKQQGKGCGDGRQNYACIVAQTVAGRGLQGAEGVVGLEGVLGNQFSGKQHGK